MSAWGTAFGRVPHVSLPMTTVLIFCGGEGPGPLERWVQGGRVAALRDLVRLASRLPGVSRTVVATSERNLADEHPDLPVAWDSDPPGGPRVTPCPPAPPSPWPAAAPR